MHEIIDIKGIANSIGNDDTYVLVAEFPEIDYALIYRDNKYQPWVAAWCPNIEKGCWGQGHYFGNLVDAMEYIRTKQGRINYYRMDEIASKAIDGLFEDDAYEAKIYCEETLELDEAEKAYFGIDCKVEEDAYDDWLQI